MNDERIHVLLVEDNDSDAHLIRATLRTAKRAAFEITHATLIEHAVEKLAGDTYDVMLLDLSLPDSFGIDTIKRVRQVAADLPIVVLTGSDDDQLGLAALEAGAQDYLVKGHTEADLLTRSLRYAITRRGVERAEREYRGLRDAVDAMRHVLGTVGHELRTPLAAIRATAELLLSDQWDDDQQQQFLDAIHNESVRMADIVENILEAARINSGTARWDWQTVQLADVADEAGRCVTSMIDPARVTLNVRVDPQPLTIQGDDGALRRLLINLLTNAARHTEDGSIDLTIESTEDQSKVRITVRDTGCGIDPRIVEHLGKAFVLNAGAVGPTHVSGAGLGLSICRGIVGAHGGDISFTTEPDHGTTFTVMLRADLCAPATGCEIVRIHQRNAA